MNKGRYIEEYEEWLELIWPSKNEEKITSKFYENISHITKDIIPNNKNKRFNFLSLIFSLITFKK